MATFLIGILLVFSLYFFVICPIKQGLEPQANDGKDAMEAGSMFFEELGINDGQIKSFQRCSGNFANQVILVKFHNGISAIFKPSDGELAFLRTGIDKGTYYRRERAAYLVDKFLGLNMIPPTTIRDIEGKTGSLQLFIDKAKEGINLNFDKREAKIFKDQLITMWVFDRLIYNSDRHNSNWLFLDERIFAIDNGLSFGNSHHIYINEYYEEELTPSLIKKLENGVNNQTNRNTLRELLNNLLPDQEISAFFSRLDYIGKLAIKYKKIPLSAKKEFEQFKH